jgi:hypothetical protein
MQLIPWTERRTGALVGAGSLWPILGNHNQFLTPVLIPKIRPGFHAVLGNQNQTDSFNQFLGWLELPLQQSFFSLSLSKVSYYPLATKFKLHFYSAASILQGNIRKFSKHLVFCRPCLARQGYCVQIHYRKYSSLMDFGPY